jgi:hypothetical protein
MNENYDVNKMSPDRREIAREAGLSTGSGRDVPKELDAKFDANLDQVNDSMIDDEGDDVGNELAPTFSAENEALSRYEDLQHDVGAPVNTSGAPKDFTKEDAREIAEGVKEAGVLNPHKDEVGGPEPKHHMDHM